MFRNVVVFRNVDVVGNVVHREALFNALELAEGYRSGGRSPNRAGFDLIQMVRPWEVQDKRVMVVLSETNMEIG